MKKQTAITIALIVFVVAGGVILYFVRSDRPVLKSDIASTTIATDRIIPANAADAPTCVLTSDKRLYAPGTTMRFTWTSKNATEATFVRRENIAGTPEAVQALVHIPEGAGSPNIDTDSGPPNGSRTAQAGTWGDDYEVAILEVYGPGGDGYCTAQYFIGNDDLPAGTIPIPFDTLPVTLTFDQSHVKAISNDNTLSITRKRFNFIYDDKGVVTDGNAVFLIRDGKTFFPAYVSLKTPQTVYIKTGWVLLKLSLVNGNVVLEVTPQAE